MRQILNSRPWIYMIAPLKVTTAVLKDFARILQCLGAGGFRVDAISVETILWNALDEDYNRLYTA